MTRLIIWIFPIVVLIGCQSTQTVYHPDPSFGLGVQHPFDVMIQNARQPDTHIGSVFFAFDRSDLDKDMKLELDAVAMKLQDSRGPVFVGGHTDHINSDAYNKRLSYERAQQVARYLISAGVWAERITVHCYGESRPVDSNWNDDGRSRNRRVDIAIADQGEGMSGEGAIKANRGMYQEESPDSGTSVLNLFASDPNEKK